MKKVDIYLVGDYNSKFKSGTYAYYLSYKRCVIKRVGAIENAHSYVSVLLEALEHALHDMQEPCDLTIYSKTALGFTDVQKAIEKDKVYNLMVLINKSGHTAKFIDDDDFYTVQIWEDVYGRKEDKPDNGRRTSREENPYEQTNSKTGMTNENRETGRKHAGDADKDKSCPLSHHEPKSQKPDIGNNTNPNDIFGDAKAGEVDEGTYIGKSSSWRDLYSELMSDDAGAWVPGSGGY